MNAVIYARYSSSAQTEQSIEGQLRVCHEYAGRNGYSIIHEYIDRATTGLNDDRPDFLQMIEDAGKRQFQYVLVYKLDRFSRNRYDSVFYKHKLQQYGIKVISAMEAISDTQEGKLVEGLLEMIAEMYSHDLSQKVKRGLKESALKGTFTGGNMLYGYKAVEKRVTVDEERADVVRFAFESYAAGMPKKKLVAELNARGHRTLKGGKFTINSLHNALRNRKYIGENVYNGILSENSYPAIIENDLFDRVQAKLDEKKRAPARAKAKEEYLLSGKAFCGYCGAKLVGISGTSKTSERHHYYACANQFKHKSCNKKYEKKGYLEWYVVEQTLEYVLTPKCASEIADLVIAEYEKNITSRKIKEYEKQLEKIDAEFDDITEKMIRAKSDTVIDKLNERAKDLELIKADTDKELSKLRLATTMQHTKEDILNWLKVFTRGDVLSAEYQRRIIDVFVNSIYLFDDKIIIYYNIEGGKQVSFIEMLENIEELENITHETDFDGLEDNESGVLISCASLRQTTPNKNPCKYLFKNGLFGIIVSR